jgi:hypothetical protein
MQTEETRQGGKLTVYLPELNACINVSVFTSSCLFIVYAFRL